MSGYPPVQANRATPAWTWPTAIAVWAAYLLVLWLAWQTASMAGIDGTIDDDTPNGLLIQDVQLNSPAWAAGIRPGDHVVAIDDVPFTTVDLFFATLNQVRPVSTHKYSIRPAGNDDPTSVEELSVSPASLLEDSFTLMMFSVFTIAGAFTGDQRAASGRCRRRAYAYGRHHYRSAVRHTER
jgi:PDZ domain